MNGRERVLTYLDGKPVDCLPLMPVVMMFCADHIGVEYGDSVKDHRVLAEAQIRTAADYEFDIVSRMSDPAREAADCGASTHSCWICTTTRRSCMCCLSSSSNGTAVR
jgi:hypothetical protein